MTWAVGLSLPVVAVALGLAWFLARRETRDAAARGEFRLQVVGYRTDRVDEALARLDAQIAENDVLLRAGSAPDHVAPPAAAAGGGPPGGGPPPAGGPGGGAPAPPPPPPPAGPGNGRVRSGAATPRGPSRAARGA